MIISLLRCNLLGICGQLLMSKYRFFDANSTHFPLTPCEFFCGFGVPFLAPVRQNVCISKMKVFLFYQNCGSNRRLQIYQKWKINFLPCLMSQFKVNIKLPSGVVTTFAYKIATAWEVPVFGVILVRILPHSGWTRRDTPYLSVFSPNTEKYWPE